MLVEDEAILSIGIEEELREAGFRVAGPFASCAAAIDYLRDAKPSAAVVDSLLMDGSCEPLVKELRRRGVPIVIHSGTFEIDFPFLTGLPWIDKPAATGDVAKAVAALLADVL